MTNAELIEALRYCKEHERCDNDSVAECPYEHHWTDGEDCQYWLLADAADALEAADAEIVKLNTKCADLQSQINEMENEIEELLPKEGEWIEVHDWLQIPQEERGTYRCSACGQVMKYPWNYCPNCGARMRGEHDG